MTIIRVSIQTRHLPGGSVIKSLPTTQETQVLSLGQEDPLVKEMATQDFFPGKSHAQSALSEGNQTFYFSNRNDPDEFEPHPLKKENIFLL